MRHAFIRGSSTDLNHTGEFAERCHSKISRRKLWLSGGRRTWCRLDMDNRGDENCNADTRFSYADLAVAFFPMHCDSAVWQVGFFLPLQLRARLWYHGYIIHRPRPDKDARERQRERKKHLGHIKHFGTNNVQWFCHLILTYMGQQNWVRISSPAGLLAFHGSCIFFLQDKLFPQSLWNQSGRVLLHEGRAASVVPGESPSTLQQKVVCSGLFSSSL